jgi:Fic family protein
MSALARELAALRTAPGVEATIAAAREACTELRWHPALRRRSEEARAEAGVRAARGSAALEGARYPVDLLRDAARGAAALPDDASGRSAAGALRAITVAREVERTVRSAPAQALARLHLAATAGLLPPDEAGRPRTDGPPRDGFGDPAPVGPALAARLEGLSALLGAPDETPALLVAALAHAEVLAVRPFRAGNGVVARALARAVLVGRGLDPTGVVVWEAAHLAAGPRYREALLGYASGRAEGVAAWLVHCGEAVVAGAGEGRAVADAVLAGRLGR